MGTDKCELCKCSIPPNKASKLLNRIYCSECIGAARSQRRRRLNENQPERLRRQKDKDLQARITDAKKYDLKSVRAQVLSDGIQAVFTNDLPLRLKRNEKVYLLGGSKQTQIALALTTNRIFFVETDVPLSEIDSVSKRTSVTAGMRTFPLAGIIALDSPRTDKHYRTWTNKIHFDNGRDLAIRFSVCREARVFHVVLAELIDRLNDPIDETAFSPRRERIPDDIKVSVWRRDGGCCVRCGSREKLEYDHVIPVSKGGSNTIRNIELLCESCNRAKSAKIT